MCPGEVVGQGAVDNGSGGITVRLSHVLDWSPEQWGWGLTNIFFAPLPSALQSPVQTGADWRATELAEVVTGEGLETVYAARFKQPDSDAWHYVVDTAGNLDFGHAVPLVFDRRGSVEVANVALDVRAKGGSPAARTVPDPSE